MKRDGVIPEKLYCKIGEVASLVGVEPYVLRYWETEFTEIQPGKSRTGQRLYQRKDIETIREIKKLLYEEGFTIEGARKKIRGDRNADRQGLPLLKKMRKGLEEVLEMLGQDFPSK